ncbi:hypothetical protein CHS0354_032086 [Potamilus streckersoni]|uniref:Uncharacterized protein n=1 Tax=Potamilus streckersoni TaxID=2493646 RepID=A0AAE0TL73_9BIVA|nr:hypothetical protein CHS0354_032086 [Potamilus streckersoni]
MRILYLQPSHIRYSQDSINNYFDSKSIHSNIRIGETLDDLCEGRCRIEDIENISVVKKDGMWFTADNRRLWVFRNLERLGKCTKIPVYVTNYIPNHKFTTDNDGESVFVRRNPGGRWHLESTPNSNDTSSTKHGLSGRHTELKLPIPSRLIQDQVSTQNAVAGIHTATEKPEVQEPRFQKYKTFDHSVHTKTNLISSDTYTHIQYAPMIQTFSDDDGTDVHIPVEEPEVQVPDETFVAAPPENKSPGNHVHTTVQRYDLRVPYDKGGYHLRQKGNATCVTFNNTVDYVYRTTVLNFSCGDGSPWGKWAYHNSSITCMIRKLD